MSEIIDKTQPDQNNSNGKLKYFTNERSFEQPLFRFYNDDNTLNKTNSILYGANSKLINKDINQNTSYTRNKIEASLKKNPTDNFDEKYFPSTNVFRQGTTRNQNSCNPISSNSNGFRQSTIGNPNDFSKKVSIESEFKIPEYSKVAEIPEFKSNDGRIFKLTNDRRRNLDYSEYLLPGSKISTGFGNINNLSQIKYGDATRDVNGSSRDKELDRFHFTYRNYQNPVYGSNEFPKDTRYLNKKF